MKRTVVELRQAINFGKEAVQGYQNRGEAVPEFVYQQLIELYEELTEALSIGE